MKDWDYLRVPFKLRLRILLPWGTYPKSGWCKGGPWDALPPTVAPPELDWTDEEPVVGGPPDPALSLLWTMGAGVEVGGAGVVERLACGDLPEVGVDEELAEVEGG